MTAGAPIVQKKASGSHPLDLKLCGLPDVVLGTKLTSSAGAAITLQH